MNKLEKSVDRLLKRMFRKYRYGMVKVFSYLIVISMLIQFIIEVPSLLLLVPFFLLISKVYLRHKSLLVVESTELENIDQMSGVDFENYLYDFFRSLGYKVKFTRNSADYGVDLILKDKKGIKTAVQAKRYNSNVSIDAVQAVEAGKKYYHCSNAIVITNSHFTKNAVELAHTCKVKLWSREDLIRTIPNDKKQNLIL
ncbi:restriction endonuclease [Natranaerobius trueperi]|uniref:Restriction endonuclease type IV Mrr domain-containing protein n=1 Tax=Natranaerobius trueperi TaxID=759412 RepID=A0A226BYM2_9FIRM|nr:restriction endonuclease [Natranaerobius trueperi]OWZ84113.1 hypothetical protein CDO51_05200 [Natranaerobius trueperi]